VPAWDTLVRLLPAGTNVVWFQNEFDRIVARDFAEMEGERRHLLDRVRICDEALAELPSDQGPIIAHRAACLVARVTRTEGTVSSA
jgi:hypothetical protein